jgi:superfamily I DNA/RNA helicase
LTALRQARAAGRIGKDPFERHRALDRISHLTDDFIYDEITSVLDAREVPSVEDYLVLARPGREPLDDGQRRSIWAIREAFDARLRQQAVQRWSVARREAAGIARSGRMAPAYHAIIVDEAQDLEPTTLVALKALLKPGGELFITADANQSIYGASFQWSDTHRQLESAGRIETLTTNYRSTREIATAASSYLCDGTIDDGVLEQAFVHEGPLPALRTVRTTGEEVDLLARFILGAARQLHLTKGSAAVLCPSANEGERIAHGLQAAGIPSKFVLSKDLDVDDAGVKVLPLRSAKGLEFPIVALAGFWPPYPFLPAGAGKQEREYRLRIERRTLFVGMTRAMRALLVIRPESQSSIFEQFDHSLWNTIDSQPQ